jgi:alcohol dehydrogenase YqhD (iron-dependent ADH family)
MENFIAYNPTKVHFGQGVLAQLGEVAARFGRKALLLYGRGSVMHNGSYRDTVNQLDRAGIEITEYSGIKPNPVIDDVDQAARAGIKNGVNMIVAVGGGSVIDSAKIIAVAITERCHGWDIMKGLRDPERAIPIIAVLTLAATGSEMNAVAVVQNNQTMEKFGFRHPVMFPSHSFLDPGYTRTVPASHTGYGITDLVAHVLESYFGQGEASLSDRFAASIILEAMEYGPELLNRLDDYDLRARIMWAATNALNGLLSAGRVNGDFTSHALGHQLSLLYDTPHGASLSIAFPAWMRHMIPRIGNRLEKLGHDLFGEASAGQTIKHLENFFARVGCPIRLGEIGIGPDQKDEIVSLVNKNKCNGKNPDNYLDDLDRKEIVELMFEANQ